MVRRRFIEALRSIVVAALINAIILAAMTLLFWHNYFPNGNKTVYTTRTGECYHLAGCSSLSRSKYETTLAEAVEDGYRQCSNCDPPALCRKDEFHFGKAHYIALVPFCAMWAFAGSSEVLWLDLKHPSLLYLAHLAFSILLSIGFDALI